MEVSIKQLLEVKMRMYIGCMCYVLEYTWRFYFHISSITSITSIIDDFPEIFF